MKELSKWAIDPSHTKVGFSVTHFGISETDGFFRAYDAEITAHESDFSDLKLAVAVKIDSIDTNDEQRDAHLKAADFFDAEHYPEMRFESTQLVKTDRAQQYKLHGNITIRSVTKPVIFDLNYIGTVPEDPFGNTKAGFILTGEINRQDFGLTFNVLLGTGNLAVSNAVKIKVPFQLLKL